MSRFCLIMIVAVLICGIIGYETASRDLLQQVFLSRKLSHRLAECLSTGFILVILLLYVPRKLMCLIPLIVCAAYILVCFGLREAVQHLEPDESRKESANSRIWETVLCTAISIFVAVGIGLFICLALTQLPNPDIRSYISEGERLACYSLLIGVLSLLLTGLVHFLLLLRLYPSSGDNPSCALLQLRRTLRIPHRI